MKAAIAALALLGLAAANELADGSVRTERVALVPGLGKMSSVCHSGGSEPKMFLEIDALTFEGMFEAGVPPFEGSVPVPDECAPFKHVFYAYSPIGHPAWDGRGGGFGVPHMDVHFFTISSEERERLMGECTVYPGTKKCNMYHEDNEKFFNLPAPEYHTGFNSVTFFGGNAVPQHGLHLIVGSDIAPNGPLDCQSKSTPTETGSKGDWHDCHYQMLSVLGLEDGTDASGEVLGEIGSPRRDGLRTFRDHKCSCAPWLDGVTPILMCFDGHVTASEIMPTLKHSAMLGKELPNPYQEDFPVAERHEITHRPAVKTWSYKTDRGWVQFGLQLAEDEVCGDDCKGGCCDALPEPEPKPAGPGPGTVYPDGSVRSEVHATIPAVGKVTSVCLAGGSEPKMFLEFDADTFENMFENGAPPLEGSVPIPEACAPYNHFFYAYSPIGHPGWDGKGGGYGVPHWDIHAFIISSAERESKMGTCVVYENTKKCNQFSPANEKFYKLPDPEYITGFNSVTDFGGNAVPMHGLHLLVTSDLEANGPLDCRSTGRMGDWHDCHYQQLSVLGIDDGQPGHGPLGSPRADGSRSFRDYSCACAPWLDGVSPILMTFDGAVTASEIMPTLKHASMLGTLLPNPYQEPFPAQERYAVSLRPAVKTWSYKTDNGLVQFGLQLAEDIVLGDDVLDGEDDAAPGPATGDSATWHKRNDPSKDCNFVANNPAKFCTLKGDGAVYAFEACKATCGAEGATCEDDEGWYKAGDKTKNCAWAARFINRCAADGEDGRKGYEACHFACKTCDPDVAFCGEPCADDATWHKRNSPGKSCAFVAAEGPKFCTLKGEGAVWGFQACKEACGACASECVDDVKWHKAGDTAKTCAWAKRFINRCAVDGADGRKGFDACPFSCGTCAVGGAC